MTHLHIPPTPDGDLNILSPTLFSYPPPRRPSLILSPFAGRLQPDEASYSPDTQTFIKQQRTKDNIAYLHLCLKDSLSRNEAPWASHGFYPSFLDDNAPSERRAGFECEQAWLDIALSHSASGGLRLIIATYLDRGISPGMIATLKHITQNAGPSCYELDFRNLEPKDTN